jgi:large subunit ribosomal protein L24
MAGLFVKRGDTVYVRSGKDRGARGKVLLTIPDRQRVIVEGVNRVKKHTKIQSTTRGAQEGGILHQEAAIHVSNVQVVCPACGEPSRVGHRKDEEGHNVRTCRKCGADI